MTQRCCCGCCQVMNVAKAQAVLLSIASVVLLSFMIAYYEYFPLAASIGVLAQGIFELIAAMFVFIACKKYKEKLMIPMLVYCVLAAICLTALSALCYIRYRSQYEQDGKEFLLYIMIISCVSSGILLLFFSIFIRCFYYLRGYVRIHKPNKEERLKSSYGPQSPRPRSLLIF